MKKNVVANEKDEKLLPMKKKVVGNETQGAIWRQPEDNSTANLEFNENSHKAIKLFNMYHHQQNKYYSHRSQIVKKMQLTAALCS